MSRVWAGMTAALSRFTRPTATRRQIPAPGRPAQPRVPTQRMRRRLAYAPQPDGRADPGEIVWTWVAYEDEPRQGKDRRCWSSAAPAARCSG